MDNLTNRELMIILRRFGACSGAREWIGSMDGRIAWDTCDRPDWMFWLMDRLRMDQTLIVRVAIAIAQVVVTKYVPAGKLQPQEAVDAASRWVENPTEENRILCRVAARAARAAAAAFYVAADAAFYAAAAAAAADAAACDAAYDAAAARAAAAAAAAAAAGSLDIPDIIRGIISFEMLMNHIQPEEKHGR